MTEPAKAPPAADVAVRGPDGAIYQVPASELSQLPEGADLATPDELRHAELQSKYGGTGGEFAAAGLGAARGLTFGLSDQAIAGIGGEGARQSLAGYEEANPTASTVGEIAGVAAPLLLSGGSAAPEAGASLLGRGVRAAGALPRAVSAFGGAVERVGARALGEGATSLGGRLAQRALPSALGAAAEGAAYGVGHEVSESAIQNHELTAEKLLAGAGRGALWGALAGGGLSAGGTLAREGAQGLAGAVAKRVEGSSLGAWLETKSGETAFRAAGGGKRLAKAADDFAEGGFANVGKIWRDEAPALAGKRSFSSLTREDLGVAAAKGLEREGGKLSEVLGKVDEAAAASNALPKAMDVVGDVDAIIGKLSERAGNGPAVSRLEAFKSDVQRITGMFEPTGALAPNAADIPVTFQQLRDFRVDADKMWKGAKASPDLVGVNKVFGDLRNNLESRVTNGVEAYGGKGALDAYKTAKQKAQAFYLLQDATKNATAAAGSNRFLSLTDSIAGHVGSATGALLGGPVGTVVGGALGAAANRFVRTRGDFIAADALQSVANLAAIQRATAELDARMTSGVRAFIEGGKRAERAAVGVASTRRREQLMEQARDIASAAPNPTALQARLERAIGQTADFAPNITAQAAVKLAGAYQYLAASAPTPRTNTASLTPRFETERISETDLRQFARQLEAMRDPLSILDDMASGKLSHDKVRAVRDNYPALFDELRDEVISQAARKGGKLSWEQRKQAAILFDAATDDALMPDFVASMQIAAEANAPQAAQQPEGKAPEMGSRRPMKLNANAFETDAQQAEGR